MSRKDVIDLAMEFAHFTDVEKFDLLVSAVNKTRSLKNENDILKARIVELENMLKCDEQKQMDLNENP